MHEAYMICGISLLQRRLETSYDMHAVWTGFYTHCTLICIHTDLTNPWHIKTHDQDLR